MLVRKLLIVPLLLGLGAFACEPNCESMCDKAQDEGCKNYDHGACVHLCTDVEDMKDDTDRCSEEWDAYFECVMNASDICDIADEQNDSSKCDGDRQDWNECVFDFCENHTSRDYCTGTVPPPVP